MARSYAGVLGAAAFATVVVRGMIHGGGVESTLGIALVSLIGFTVVGLAAGAIADMTVTQAVQTRINAELEANSQQRSGQVRRGQGSSRAAHDTNIHNND